MQIETTRLIIRDFQPQDCDELYLVLSDPEVMKYSLSGLHSKEMTREFIQRCIKAYLEVGYGPYAVVLKHLNVVIGFCGLGNQEVDNIDEVELGYRLGSQFWRQGYASEAAIACKDFAFNQLHLNRLISCIDPGNIGSIGVAEKVGMRLEKNAVFHGVPILLYAIQSV